MGVDIGVEAGVVERGVGAVARGANVRGAEGVTSSTKQIQIYEAEVWFPTNTYTLRNVLESTTPLDICSTSHCENLAIKLAKSAWFYQKALPADPKWIPQRPDLMKTAVLCVFVQPLFNDHMST